MRSLWQIASIKWHHFNGLCFPLCPELRLAMDKVSRVDFQTPLKEQKTTTTSPGIKTYRKFMTLMPLCNCRRIPPESIRPSGRAPPPIAHSGSVQPIPNKSTSNDSTIACTSPQFDTTHPKTTVPAPHKLTAAMSSSSPANSLVIPESPSKGYDNTSRVAFDHCVRLSVTSTSSTSSSLTSSSETLNSTPSCTASPAAQLITQVKQQSFSEHGGSIVGPPSSSALSFVPSIILPTREVDSVCRWPLLGPQLPKDRGKNTLVLDLDETLVHSAFKPVSCYAFEISVDIEGQRHDIFVSKRPGVDEFLTQVSQLYEVVVFTASLEKYANPVIDLLDMKETCKWRLFRESCTQVSIPTMGTLNYVKDLSKLGRDIRRVIIVDNSPFAYSFHPENAIPIRSWFDDQTDRELYELLPILKELSKVENVPDVMRSTLSI